MKTPTYRTLLRSSAVLSLSALALTNQAHAASSTWGVDSGGTWSSGPNWVGSVIPGATSGTTSTDVATFLRSTNTAGTDLINFDSNYNLGGITFNNNNTSTSVYQIGGATFGGATTGTLTLSNNAQILVTGTGATNVTHGLDVNIVLAGNASVVNNFSNSVFNFGLNSGASANTVTTGTGLGNIDVTLGGTSTGSNLWSMRITQGVGTTVRLVKEGTGFWQINGVSSGTTSQTGGLLIRQGGVSIGRNSAASIGTGLITLGDNSTVAGDLTLLTGSSITVSNNITVASSAATNVIIERQATGGDSIYQGTITLERDLVLRQNSASTARNLNIGSNSVLTGTGNVVINTTLAGATGSIILGGGSGAGLGSINMTGQLINQSTTGAAGVSVTGKVLSNVTAVVQNSGSSTMTLSNGSNSYGVTNVTAGTLVISSTGKLGTGDVTVSAPGILTLQTASAIDDTADLLFANLATINLTFTGTDTIGALGNTTTSTFITAGTYNATQLNTFFGGSVFTGGGSLLVTAVPEPGALGLLATAAFGLTVFRRRRVR